MKLTIHRGTHEIGGNCVEVTEGKDRILIDIGMPLVKPDKSRFDIRLVECLSGCDLIKHKGLPDIKGIYKWDAKGKGIDALLISHPHIDHYGFYQYLRTNTLYCLGEGAKRLMELTGIFTPVKGAVKRHIPIKSGKSFRIKSFNITPFLMDHSGFDAYAFLVEANGRSLFYSGDFRSHGRKIKAFEWFLRNGPNKVDVLLLEGTTLGRDKKKVKTEEEVEEEFTETIKKSNNITLVCLSSQNIDRFVSLYKAAVKNRKLLVVDIYTANILDALKDQAKIPYPSRAFPAVRVYFHKKSCDRLKAVGREESIYKFKRYKITREEISQNRENIVMVIRSSLVPDLSKITGIERASFIYSMWEGYLEQDSMKKLLQFIRNKDMKFYSIHTSGHADVKTLKRMVKKLNPGVVIPIHTFFPQEYKKELGGNVKVLNDGETYKLDNLNGGRKSGIYDKRGNLIEECGYKADGDFAYRINFKYDKRGDSVEGASYNKEGELTSKSTYKHKYDAKDNMVERVSYSQPDGNLTNRDIYKYDKDGNQIECVVISYDERGKPAYKTINTYDNKGRPIGYVNYQGDQVRDRRSFKYDAKGNLIEDIQCDPDGTPRYKWVNRYNKQGKIISSDWCTCEPDGSACLIFRGEV